MYNIDMKKVKRLDGLEGIVVKDAKPLVFIKPVGRPIKFSKETPDLVNKYTNRCLKVGMIPTIEGLACELGVVPDTIQDWKGSNHKRLVKTHKSFSVSLKFLLAKQSEMLQHHSLTGKYATTMGIFLLKNNHGFKDKHEVDHTAEGERIEKITYTVPKGTEDGGDQPQTNKETT